MLLYWGMFTVGFLFGSILAFVTFAPKKPEDDAEYETQPNLMALKSQSGGFESKNDLPEMVFTKNPQLSSNPTAAFAQKDSKNYKVSLIN